MGRGHHPDLLLGAAGLAAGADLDLALDEHVQSIGRIALADDRGRGVEPHLGGGGGEPLEDRPAGGREDVEPLEQRNLGLEFARAGGGLAVDREERRVARDRQQARGQRHHPQAAVRARAR